MEKKYFVVKQIPCRPDFAFTMTDAERQIMEEHKSYWAERMREEKVVAYGPVLDMKNGPYGLGIVCVQDDAELEEMLKHDPAGQINTFETAVMMALVPEK